MRIFVLVNRIMYLRDSSGDVSFVI